MWLLLACASPEPADSAAPETVEEDVDLAPPERGVQLEMGPIEVPAGTEQYLCKVTTLPNAEPMDVVALEHAASPSMHHFNIWGLLAAPAEDLEGDCDTIWSQTSMQLASPLYASQDPTFYGAFPEGVAAQLPAGQPVLLEYHIINTGPEPIEAEARFNAYAAEPGTVEQYANGVYGSIGDLSLPPHEESVFTQKCYVDYDINVFAIGSHFHARGTLFEIYTLGADGEADELVYENTDWSSPRLDIRSDDPLEIAAGGGFEFRCHYDNQTDDTITYGENSTDEMCMMAAVYYPDQGFLRCRDSR